MDMRCLLPDRAIDKCCLKGSLEKQLTLDGSEEIIRRRETNDMVGNGRSIDESSKIRGRKVKLRRMTVLKSCDKYVTYL